LRISHESSDGIFVLRNIKENLLKIANEGDPCLAIMDEVHEISDAALKYPSFEQSGTR